MLCTSFSILLFLGAARLSKSIASHFIRVSVVSRISPIKLQKYHVSLEKAATRDQTNTYIFNKSIDMLSLTTTLRISTSAAFGGRL